VDHRVPVAAAQRALGTLRMTPVRARDPAPRPTACRSGEPRSVPRNPRIAAASSSTSPSGFLLELCGFLPQRFVESSAIPTSVIQACRSAWCVGCISALG
jgi:hypothetical protein